MNKERLKQVLLDIYGPDRVAEDDGVIVLQDPFYAPDYETLFIPLDSALIVHKKWGDKADTWVLHGDQAKRIAGEGKLPAWVQMVYKLAS